MRRYSTCFLSMPCRLFISRFEPPRCDDTPTRSSALAREHSRSPSSIRPLRQVSRLRRFTRYLPAVGARQPLMSSLLASQRAKSKAELPALLSMIARARMLQRRHDDSHAICARLFLPWSHDDESIEAVRFSLFSARDDAAFLTYYSDDDYL